MLIKLSSLEEYKLLGVVISPTYFQTSLQIKPLQRHLA